MFLENNLKVCSEVENHFPLLKVDYYHEYGNIKIINEYCNIIDNNKYVNGEWQHGVNIPERNIHPEFVIGSDGKSRERKSKRYYVARKDQADFLKGEGYTNVKAIGMPIIYITQEDIKRLPNTLLIMPSHSLDDTNEFIEEESYAKYIDSIAHRFSTILCCIHESCYKKGYWVETFRRRGIQVIATASESDANTLQRQSYLFSRFEYLTSNDFGSHLVYGAFWGIKPSIAGPKPFWDKSFYCNTLFYKNAPEILDILETWYKIDYLRLRYPFLYVEPHLATSQIDWAKFILGFENKLPPSKLISLFGYKAQNPYITRFLRHFKSKLKFYYLALIEKNV